MSQEHLMESIFDKVLEEKRNNTPVPSNEENDANDIELLAVEENKDEVDVPKIETCVDAEIEKDELVESTEKCTEKDTEKCTEKDTEKDTEKCTEKDTEKCTEKDKSKYAILCASLSKLLCRK